MKNTIEARELITLDGLDVIVRVTYHKPYDDGSGSESHLIERERVGVVFFNGYSATRAGHGDAAVYWADSFAERGYPAFRLDLPGFGDSDGEPPTEWLDFINMGGYAPVASAKIRELVARFNLSGVVIMGQCSGAVSAICTAATTKDCKGLILMEPYFHLPHTIGPKIRQQLNFWTLQSRLGGLLSKIYGLLKEIRLFLSANSAPGNANFLLLRNWKELASMGLPILILMVPGRATRGTKPKFGEFDYLKHVVDLAGRRSQVVISLVDGANHTFANREGRAAVLRHVEHWLNTCFPLLSMKKGLGTPHVPNPSGVSAKLQFARIACADDLFRGK